MTLFGSKLDIFAHKTIYYTNENSLIFQGYVVDICFGRSSNCCGARPERESQ